MRADPNPPPLTDGQQAILAAIPLRTPGPFDLQFGPVAESLEPGSVITLAVDPVAERLDELADLLEVWKRHRAADRAPHHVRGAAIEACREVALLVVQRPTRDRETDRVRFPGDDFNRWLDDPVTENAEFTVRHMLSDTADAWAGWNAHVPYAAAAPAIGEALR